MSETSQVHRSAFFTATFAVSWLLGLVMLSGCVASPVSESAADGPQIALTFDDAPRGDGPFFSGPERTKQLISALRSAGVDEAMLFVTTRNLERPGGAGEARIRAYADAGHTLGNHSHSHQWLSRIDTDQYLADLDLAISALGKFDRVQPLYRYPYLDEGRTVEKRDRLRRALADRGLRNGYVTVDTYDWYLAALAKEAVGADREFDMAELRALYVDVIVSSTEFYDAMAVRTIGRSPRHVLLLHENDLAALFIGDLVSALRERGWTIIPATTAFADPIASREPDTVFLGQGRIAALAHEAGEKPASLVSPTEDEEYLKRRFEAEVLGAGLTRSLDTTTSSAEESMIEHQVNVGAPPEVVWHALTTEEGLAIISSKSNIELEIGGAYEWFLDGEPDEKGVRGSAGSRIVAYVPNRMLTFDWTFPPDTPSLRYAGEMTQVTILIRESSPGESEVQLFARGFKEGAEWQAGYEYFDKAWDYVLTALKKGLESGR